jgi:hypothetical protein
MTDPRIVLEYFVGGVQHVLDLPDAEHIHLTRHPDGRWTAVPMEPSDGHWIVRSEPPLLWRDVPTEPEDGAR